MLEHVAVNHPTAGLIAPKGDRSLLSGPQQQGVAQWPSQCPGLLVNLLEDDPMKVHGV